MDHEAEEAERAAHLAAAQAQQRREHLRHALPRVIGALIAVLLVVVGAAWTLLGNRPPTTSTTATDTPADPTASATTSPDSSTSPTPSAGGSATGTASAPAGLTGLVSYPHLARDHTVGTVTYAQNPPVGGTHSPVWQNCGIYDRPVTNENAVHSLEHGAFWITYRPDLPADQVATLHRDVAGQEYALVSPYPGLPAPVVATAWGVQLRLPSVTDPRLKTFIAAYADGSRAPEPRGECTGGLGTPTAP